MVRPEIGKLAGKLWLALGKSGGVPSRKISECLKVEAAKGNNAKIQLNYNWVDEPNENNNKSARGFREVRNDNFVVNFQVAW